MDTTQLADLYKLLVNPVSFGVLLSLFWEQTAFFKDEQRSPALKIGIVMLSALVWSIIISALSATGLPTTLPGWGSVLAMAVSVAISTQIFHKFVNEYFPAIGDFLVNLKTPGTVTVTQTAQTPTTSTSVTSQTVTGTIDTTTPVAKAMAAGLIPPTVEGDTPIVTVENAVG